MKIFWNLLSEGPTGDVDLSAREWLGLEPLLAENQLDGLIYAKYGQALPSPMKEKFATRWKSQWLRNHLYLDVLKKLRELADQNNLNFITLKGAGLLESVYQDLGSRQMSDIDLLIPLGQVEQFEAVLKNNGFVKGQTGSWFANDYKSIFTIDISSFELVVELHTRLFYLESSETQWQIDNQKTLSPTDNLIHLVGHYSYQHTFLKLFWLIDIDRFVRRYSNEIDWARVESIAVKLRMRKAVHATLWVAHRYLQTPVPENMCSGRSLIQRLLLKEKFLWKKKFSLTYYILKFDIRDSGLDSVSYSFFWLLDKLKAFGGRLSHPVRKQTQLHEKP